RANLIEQPLGEAAQLRREGAVAQGNLAEPAAAERDLAHRRILPIDHENPHFGEVITTGKKILLGNDLMAEMADEIEIVDAEAAAAGDGRARIAARREINLTVYLKIAVEVGEKHFGSVLPPERPAGGEARHLAREMGRKGAAKGFHRRISTSFTFCQ